MSPDLEPWRIEFLGFARGVVDPEADAIRRRGGGFVLPAVGSGACGDDALLGFDPAGVETGGGEGEEAAGDADAIFGAGDAPDESLFESFADIFDGVFFEAIAEGEG